jgi:hypothetical protein
MAEDEALAAKRAVLAAGGRRRGQNGSEATLTSSLFLERLPSKSRRVPRIHSSLAISGRVMDLIGSASDLEDQPS